MSVTRKPSRTVTGSARALHQHGVEDRAGWPGRDRGSRATAPPSGNRRPSRVPSGAVIRMPRSGRAPAASTALRTPSRSRIRRGLGREVLAADLGARERPVEELRPCPLGEQDGRRRARRARRRRRRRPAPRQALLRTAQLSEERADSATMRTPGRPALADGPQLAGRVGAADREGAVVARDAVPAITWVASHTRPRGAAPRRSLTTKPSRPSSAMSRAARRPPRGGAG